MANVQITTGGNEVKIFTSGDSAASPSQPPTPVLVSSGSRPLQISTSPSGNTIVNGVAEIKPQSTPITVVPAAATATPVQINVTPSSGGVVIRAASSADAQQPASPTSPSITSGSVTSGITIRSSASAPAPVVVVGNQQLQQQPTTAPTGISGQSQPAATTSSGPVVINQSNPAVVGIQPVVGTSSSHLIDTSGSKAPTSGTTQLSQPHLSPAPTTSSSPPVHSAPEIVAHSQQANGVSKSASQVGDIVTRPSVIRAPSSLAGSRSRPQSVVQPQQPPMTWSELTNRFDLVTVCGFMLAVLAVAFASILVGDDLPFGWLLAGVSIISVAAFVRLRL